MHGSTIKLLKHKAAAFVSPELSTCTSPSAQTWTWSTTKCGAVCIQENDLNSEAETGRRLLRSTEALVMW